MEDPLSIVEAIEMTAADMRRAYLRSLNEPAEPWTPGQLDPTGERCSCGDMLNNGVCPNYPRPKTTINTNER